MAGWHHWLDGWESEWTPGVGDGQGGLACCDSWGHKELDMTERLNWTECLNYKDCWEDAVNLSLSLSIDLISSTQLHLKAFSPLRLVSMGFPCGSAGKESACNVGDLGSLSGLGRSPGERKGHPLQYSGPEISMDCVVQGVAKSRTRPSDYHFHFHLVSVISSYQWFLVSSIMKTLVFFSLPFSVDCH